MNPRVTSILSHSREAVDYVRRAGGNVHLAAADWRPRYQRITDIGLTSFERLRQAGEQHPRVTALIGAGTAAVAAGTVLVLRQTARLYADVLSDEQPYRVSTLDDLRDDHEALSLIQRELLAEWGPFGPRDTEDMERLVRNAGRFVFVIRFYEDGVLGPPSGVLQTGLCGAEGDAGRLRAVYPTFDAITAGGTWEASPAMHGDTAMLLQITAFGDRSRGVGGRLRDTALYMLPPSVKYALTTTPVPPGFDLESDPEGSPATKFHFRGGARPAGYASEFKQPAPERSDWPEGRQSNTDVIFMRYQRLENGEWEGVKQPDLRLHRHAIDLPLPQAIRRRRATSVPAAQPVAA
jgi:hypothetical protein